MRDVTPLVTAVDRVADRLRSLPQSRLRRGGAAEGLALARALARRSQELEFPEREPYEMPAAGAFVVGDQVAVAGHDLARALRGAPAGEAADAALAEALELVAAAGRRIG